MQELVRRPFHEPPGLWVVTRGAQPVAAAVSNITRSPLWGLGRVITLEHPDLPCALIDLDPSEGSNARFMAQARMVCEEGPRGRRRFASRLPVRISLRTLLGWLGRVSRTFGTFRSLDGRLREGAGGAFSGTRKVPRHLRHFTFRPRYWAGTRATWPHSVHSTRTIHFQQGL